MSDQCVKTALGIKDDPVGTRGSASVDLVRGQNWEFIYNVLIICYRVETDAFGTFQTTTDGESQKDKT